MPVHPTRLTTLEHAYKRRVQELEARVEALQADVRRLEEVIVMQQKTIWRLRNAQDVLSDRPGVGAVGA
ncbi:MAG: hypothetical protein KatS3mg051_1718 [Anaerolineae bacterium]|nr:MAG: hypothetical protein KatS3mg051_1718 [Anaerolineae bacterium]